jgi:hypothetical protein
MKRLVEGFGVDYLQWRALTRAYFLIDHAALFGGHGSAAAARAIRRLAMIVLTFGAIGGACAIFVIVCRDPLVASTIVTTTVAMLVSALVLMQGSMIASPDDYAIVGFRPVSSRTYFAVRVTAVLVNTIGWALVSGYLPIMAYAFGAHGSVALALAALASVLVAALTTTFALMGLYGWLVRILRPSLFTLLIGWVPVACFVAVIGVFAYAAFQFLDAAVPTLNLMEGLSLAEAHLPRTTWMLAFPPVWFASCIEIVRGSAGAFEWSAAFMSLAALAGAIVMMRGRLSADFAIRVAQIASASAPRLAPRRELPSFLRGERRAIVLVMRSQLRDDVSFQMQVVVTTLSAVGIVVAMPFYFMPDDPFVTSSSSFSLLLAVGFLVLGFYEGFATSRAAEATWPFFTTAADRNRLILAARDISAVVILAPVMAAVLGLLLYSFANAAHAVVHTLVVGGLAFIELQLLVLVKPAVPFSALPGTRGGPGLRSMMAMSLPMMGFFALQRIAYRSRLGTLIGLVVIALAIVILERVLRRRK